MVVVAGPPARVTARFSLNRFRERPMLSLAASIVACRILDSLGVALASPGRDCNPGSWGLARPGEDQVVLRKRYSLPLPGD